MASQNMGATDRYLIFWLSSGLMGGVGSSRASSRMGRAVVRRLGGRELVCLFNFSSDFVTAGVNRDGGYTELMYGAHYDQIRSVQLWPNGFAWLLRDDT